MNSVVEEPRVIANVADVNFLAKGKGRGKPVFKNQYGNYPGKSGNGRGSSKFCSHCNKPGHTVDNCYKKHGFPPNYKKASINCVVEDDEEEDDDSQSVVSMRSHRDKNSRNQLGFTPEQHQAILAMLQNMQTSKSVSQVTTAP